MTKKKLKELIKHNSSIIEEIDSFISQKNYEEIANSDEIKDITNYVKDFDSKKQNFLLMLKDLQKILLSNISSIQKFIYRIQEPLDIYLKSKDNTSKLSSRGNEIEDIVKTVAAIADNTNLLSLNAAIEAAQAGKHGKGFSIVSGVIRKLARNTENLTKNIKILTNETQGGLQEVVKNFNEATSYSKEIISMGEGITGDLNSVEKGISDASDLFDYIVKLYEEYAIYILAMVEYWDRTTAEMKENKMKLNSISSIYKEQNNKIKNMLTDDNNIDPSKRKKSTPKAGEIEEIIELQKVSHKKIAKLLAKLEEGRNVEKNVEEYIEKKYKHIEEIENGFKEKNNSMLGSVASLNETYMKDREILEDMIMKVSEITALTDNANDKIKKTKEFIRKIDRLVDDVTYITIQTTLLSVNGAIEAAKAGNAGKGFATVALDIQDLAEESSSHASKIKDLLWDIQGELMKINEDVNQGVIIAKQQTSKISLQSSDLDKITMDIAILLSQINDFQQLFMNAANKKKYLIKGFEMSKKNAISWMEKISSIHLEIEKFK